MCKKKSGSKSVSGWFCLNVHRFVQLSSIPYIRSRAFNYLLNICERHLTYCSFVLVEKPKQQPQASRKRKGNIETLLETV